MNHIKKMKSIIINKCFSSYHFRMHSISTVNNVRNIVCIRKDLEKTFEQIMYAQMFLKSVRNFWIYIISYGQWYMFTCSKHVQYFNVKNRLQIELVKISPRLNTATLNILLMQFTDRSFSLHGAVDTTHLILEKGPVSCARID